MERSVGIMTKISPCFPEDYAFSRQTFTTSESKMCKDDINPGVFCSVPDSLADDNAMDVQDNALGASANKACRESTRDFRFNEKSIFSLINGKSENGVADCMLPVWNNASGLSSQNSLASLNKSVSKNINAFDSVPSNISDNSHHSFEINESSSSIEEIFCPKQANFVDFKRQYTARHIAHVDSTNENLTPQPAECIVDNQKISNESLFHNTTPNAQISKVNEPEKKVNHVLPELPPPLICIDDDESAISSVESNYEIIDVPDSPQMPILTPIESEIEALKTSIKQERLSDEELEQSSIIKEFQCTAGSIRQPQVLLQRISLSQCFPLSDSNCLNSLERSLLEKNTSIISPEIEEIEGVRFFQFRSQQEMVEFNERTEESGIDLDMIVPTKTTDITQIKGWRNKYFASESQLHSFEEDCKENESSSANLNPQFNIENKDFSNCVDSECLKVSICGRENEKVELNFKVDSDKMESSCNESKLQDSLLTKKSALTVSKENNVKNPKSAFVSESLDSFLSKFSTLNVSYLEKINPNILPIPPGSGILSLGKLRKPDTQPQQLTARNIFLHKLNYERNSKKRSIQIPEVFTLSSSSECSSDENVPVAKLNNVKRRKASLSVDLLPDKCLKRRKSETSSDLSQRLVLRITKESKGNSEGYKISDVPSKKSDESSSSASSVTTPPASPSSSSSSNSESEEELPVEFKALNDGPTPVIQKSVFVKDDEPKLLSEFIKNLNLLGTSEDVAMLVQSNQSYFNEEPVLDEAKCNEALSALLSNEGLTSLKLKPRSKRKLKTWQKYLPKKLTTNQKLKLSKVKSKTLNENRPDKDALIEDCQRGKRSIRLPARYLDSAVLAAGTEWVSPVFDDPKKSRKQLLDVLDKLKGGNSKSLENSKCESILDKNASFTQKSSLLETEEKAPISTKLTRPLKQSNKKNSIRFVKKSKTETIQKVKTQIKKRKNENDSESSSSDSSSSDAECSDDSDKSSEGLLKPIFHDFPYLLPACACMPCSRTASFNKSTKEIICFNDHSRVITGIDQNISNLDNNYTFSHEDSEPVRISIPYKENDSSDSILQYSEAIVNNGLITSEEIKTAFYEEENPNKTETIANKNISELSNDSSLNHFIRTNDKMSSVVHLKIANDLDREATQTSALKQKLNSQLTLQKSPVVPSQTGLRSELKQQMFMNPTNQSDSNMSVINAGASMNQFASAPVSTGKDNQILLQLILPVKTTSPNNSSIFTSTPPIRTLSNTTAQKPFTTIESSSRSKPSILVNKIVEKPRVIHLQKTYSSAQNRASEQILEKCPLIQPLDNIRRGRLDSFPNSSSSPLVNKSTNNLNKASQESSHPLMKAIHVSGRKVYLQEVKSKPQTVERHDYPQKRAKTRRKSPLLKRNMNDIIDTDIDIETVDEEFGPQSELDHENFSKTSANGDDLSEEELEHEPINPKTSKERQRRYILRKNFESLKRTSSFFQNASSSQEVLDKAVFAIDRYQKKEKVLKLAKHRLRMHNTRLIGKFLLLLQGIKDTEVRNSVKKQVIKNLGSDWVEQTHMRLKNNPDPPTTGRKKRVKKTVSKPTSDKVSSGIDYKNHLTDSSSKGVNIIENAPSSTIVEAMSTTNRPNIAASFNVTQEFGSHEIDENKTAMETVSTNLEFSFDMGNVDITQMDFEIEEETQSDGDDIMKSLLPKKISDQSTNENESCDLSTGINISLQGPGTNKSSQNTFECHTPFKDSEMLKTSTPKKTPDKSVMKDNSQTMEDTPSEQYSEGPLVIDISDDENPIPIKVPASPIKSEANKSYPMIKDIKVEGTSMKYHPGFAKLLIADESFEESEDNLSRTPNKSTR